ncbi:hypothetical protein AMTRI_Chr11g154780 [Amborella trichopoda]
MLLDYVCVNYYILSPLRIFFTSALGFCISYQVLSKTPKMAGNLLMNGIYKQFFFPSTAHIGNESKCCFWFIGALILGRNGLHSRQRRVAELVEELEKKKCEFLSVTNF